MSNATLTPREVLERNTRVWYRRFGVPVRPVIGDIESKLEVLSKRLSIPTLKLDSRFTALLIVVRNYSIKHGLSDITAIYNLAVLAYNKAYRALEQDNVSQEAIARHAVKTTPILLAIHAAVAKRTEERAEHAQQVNTLREEHNIVTGGDLAGIIVRKAIYKR